MDGTASPESSQRLRNRHELEEHAECKDILTRFLLVSISTCVPAMNPSLRTNWLFFSSTIRQREVPRGTALSRWQASMNQTWSKASRSGLSGHYISLPPSRTVLFLHEGPEGGDIIWGDNGWGREHPVHCSKEKSYFRRYPQPFLLF